MKAVIFARISSVAQEDGVSLDAQNEKLQAYCRDNGMEVIETYRVVESSTKGQRKQFHQALKLVEKQKSTTALVVHSTDRLLRGFKEYGLVEELIESGKLEVHVTNERLIVNRNTPWADLLKFDFSILGGKMYVNQLKEHVKKAVQYKIGQGKVIGNVPTGYLNRRDPVTNEATVVLDPERAILIKRLFEEYSTGTYSISELTKKARQWGLTSSRKSRAPLGLASIANILENPFYIGYMTYKGKRVPHVYPILIDESLFDRCQQIREGNNNKPVVSTEKPFVFRGLMKCGSCGCSITSDLKKGRYVYLACTKAKGKDKCASKRIREEKAMAVVEEVLSRLVIPDPLLQEIREYLVKLNQEEHKTYEGTVEALQKELKQQDQMLERLLNLYLEGSITQPEYDKKRNQINKNKQRISTQLASNQEGHADFQDSLVVLLKTVSKASKLFKSSKIEQKRKIITFLFSNLFLDGENISYELHAPFNKLVNLTGNQKWWPFVDEYRSFLLTEPGTVDWILAQVA